MLRIIAQVSWDTNLKQIDLFQLKDLYGIYPIITVQFFKDLVKNAETKTNYQTESGLRAIVSNEKQYEPHEWILIWAKDFKDREFQLLFSRTMEFGGKGALVAVGPPEFAEFLKQTGKDAVVPSLTLINDSTKMKKVFIIVSSPKEAKKSAAVKLSPQLARFKGWVNELKTTKNVGGQWFPTFEPVCPICNERMVGVADYRVGFAQMICPRCGFQQRKST